jgi:hypothetical protein
MNRDLLVGATVSIIATAIVAKMEALASDHA